MTTPEEAAAAAVKAGCDLCCGGDYNALVRAVQEGLITEKEIDQALYYTLWTRFRLGLFDPPENAPYSKIGMDQNDTPEHRALALKVAEESIVLLKNDGVLPLDRSKIKRIAVIGPNADSMSMLARQLQRHGVASGDNFERHQATGRDRTSKSLLRRDVRSPPNRGRLLRGAAG